MSLDAPASHDVPFAIRLQRAVLASLLPLSFSKL